MNIQVFLEWFLRLDAFVVGIGVLVLAATAAIKRQQLPRWLPWISGTCLVLVAFQGALGALTVTLLLPPGIVTAHLATALVLVMLVSVCHQLLEASAKEPTIGAIGAIPKHAVQSPGPTEPNQRDWIFQAPAPAWWPWLAGLATVLVAAQCLLGGLMATQWAASLCFSAGSGCAWLAAHRLVATPAGLAVLALAGVTALAPGWCRQQRPLTITAALLVTTQIALGVFSLRLQLSVPAVTIAHQLVAALLLAILAALTCRGWIAVVGQAGSAAAPEPRTVLSPSPAEVVHG
jgi:cytochrome c oxidase assembly protein subunit 15